MIFNKRLLIFLCLFINTCVFASEYSYVPDIIAFDKKDYGAGRQNWDITVDENNVVYIANEKGLLRYVHGHWVFDQLPSGRSLRAVCYSKDKVWCGGDEIGFFEIDESGNLTYQYLSDINGNIWNIVEKDDHVFFQSNNVITIYNIKTESIVQYTFPKNLSGLCQWKGKVWTINGENGLGTLDFDGFNLVMPFPEAQGQEVREMFVHNEQIYVVLLNGKVFAYDGQSINRINLPEQLSCFSAVHYDENTFYLGSILEGIIPVKKDGDQIVFQRKIKQNDGLLDNTVLSLAVDNNGNLWAGLDYGIAKINKESLLKAIINKGATYDVIIHEDVTYVATNKGLYANNSESEFSLIPGTQGQVWDLAESFNGLYACHNNGLISLDNNKYPLVYKETGVMSFAQLGETNNYIFSAYTGTLWMQRKGDGFVEKQNLWLWGNPKLSYDKANHCIWSYGGSADTIVHRIQVFNDSVSVTQTKMSNAFPTKYGLVFYDGGMFYQYKDDGFEKIKIALIQGIAGENISAIEISTQDNIAVYIQNNELKMIEELADGSTVIHSKLLSEVNNDILSGFECLKIHDNLLYIATEQGVKILPLNLRNSRQLSNDPIIAKIDITYSGNNKPKTIYYPNTNKALNLASRKFKTITLSFASGKKQNIEYRYRLLPYTKEWTEWSYLQKQVAYGDLKPQAYTFELECRYNGTIERKTMVPIIVEGIGYYYLRLGILIVIILALALIIIQYAKNQKLRLKHKQDRKRYIEEQIQSKKEQLLQFTEIIRHKNTFLTEVAGYHVALSLYIATKYVE